MKKKTNAFFIATYLEIISKHYNCILFPELKANIEAVFTTKARLTVVNGYLRLPLIFQKAKVISPPLFCIFWGKTRKEWNKSLNMGVVTSWYSCKLFRSCSKQRTAETFLALQKSLKFHPYKCKIHCAYIHHAEKENHWPTTSRSFGTKVSKCLINGIYTSFRIIIILIFLKPDFTGWLATVIIVHCTQQCHRFIFLWAIGNNYCISLKSIYVSDKLSTFGDPKSNLQLC